MAEMLSGYPLEGSHEKLEKTLGIRLAGPWRIKCRDVADMRWIDIDGLTVLNRIRISLPVALDLELYKEGREEMLTYDIYMYEYNYYPPRPHVFIYAFYNNNLVMKCETADGGIGFWEQRLRREDLGRGKRETIDDIHKRYDKIHRGELEHLIQQGAEAARRHSGKQ